MAANAIVVHQIPGRARLRIDEKRGDAAYFSHLSGRLSGFENVVSTKANPVTGSIAFQFSGSLDEVLRRAKEEDLLSVADGTKSGDHADLKADWITPPRLSPATHARHINLVSGREINRDFMMGSMLLLVGLVQMLRGRWFPPAFSVLWYAREAFNLAGERR